MAITIIVLASRRKEEYGVYTGYRSHGRILPGLEYGVVSVVKAEKRYE